MAKGHPATLAIVASRPGPLPSPPDPEDERRGRFAPSPLQWGSTYAANWPRAFRCIPQRSYDCLLFNNQVHPKVALYSLGPCHIPVRRYGLSTCFKLSRARWMSDLVAESEHSRTSAISS